MCQANDAIKKWKKGKFWGKLIIDFRNGYVVKVRGQETFPPVLRNRVVQISAAKT